MLDKFDEEIQTITQRRGEVYGHPADDFSVAADLMRHFDHVEPPALRHALRMICVKMARLKNTPTHFDSYVDIVGYARTAIMVMERESEKAPPEVKVKTIDEALADGSLVKDASGRIRCPEHS